MIARITRYPYLNHKYGTAEETTWEELFARWSDPGPYLGDDAHPGWSPATLDPLERADRNVVELSALVLDYEAPDVSPSGLDSPDPAVRALAEAVQKKARKRLERGAPHTIEQALSTWASCFGFLYTSRSHADGVTPDGLTLHRFRLVLPFPRGAKPDEYRASWRWADSLIPGALDPQPKDVSRFWYDPGRVEGRPFVSHVLQGTPLGLDHILAQVPAKLEAAPAEQFPLSAPPADPSARARADAPPPPGRYRSAALAAACDAVRNAPRGTRNHTMAREAYALGGLVANGELDEGEAEQALWDASVAGGWDQSAALKTHKTLQSQLRAGMAKPRTEATRAAYRGDVSIGREPGWAPSPVAAPNGNGAGGYGGAASLGLFSGVGDGLPGPEAGAARPAPAPFIPGVPRGTVVPDIVLAGVSGDALDVPPPPIPWICKSLHLAPGRPTLLVAFGGSGKTFLAIDIALAVASGGQAWGSFRCEPGKVGHLNFEMPERELLRRYQRMGAGRQLRLGSLPLEILSRNHMPGWFLYPTPEVKNTLVRFTTEMKLCVIDSLRAACPSLNEDKSEARLPLDMLLEVSDVTGVCFLVLHHSPKPQGGYRGGEERSAIHMSRGSSAIIDACDTSWVVTPATDSPTISMLKIEMGKVSLSAKRPPHHVRLVDVGEVDPETDKTPALAIEWMPEEQIEDLAAKDDDLQVRRAKTAILGALSKGSLSTNEIIKSKRVKGRKNVKAFALEQLMAEGKIDRKPGPNRSQIISLHEITVDPSQPDPDPKHNDPET